MRRIVLIGVMCLLVAAAVLTAGCQQKKTETKIEMPTVVFTTKNNSDTLMDDEQDDKVATVTLTEGKVKFVDITIQLSGDNVTYSNLTAPVPVPNNEPLEEWNAGEALIISEDNLPAGLADANGNWPSDQFYIHIVFLPLERLMFSDRITLEDSQPGTPETPTMIFLTRNASDILYTDETNDTVASVILTEGSVPISELRVQISADGDLYFNLTTIVPVPNNTPVEKWDTGEALVINEADLPAGLADANGNWPSTDFYVQVIYVPTARMVYSDHVVLEESTMSG